MLTLTLPTRILIGLAVAAGIFLLGFRTGAHLVRNQWDLATARADAARSAFLQRQHDQVAQTDRAALRIDADMRIDLGRLQIQAPQRLEVVTHAIHIDPQMGTVRLPAAVVRVRASQAAQSRAIARQAEAAVQRAAQAVQAAPGGH